MVFLNNFIFAEHKYNRLIHNNIFAGAVTHFVGFMKKGNGRIVSEDKVLELKEGDMFYIPRGLKYQSFWNMDNAVTVLDSIGFVYFPASDSSQFVLQKINMTPEIDKAFSYFSNNKEVNLYSIGNLYVLLSILENVMIKKKKTKEEVISDKLIKSVNENPILSISDYAIMLKISEALLYKDVKKATGKTPNQIRLEAICKKAAELLSSTDCSVEEISNKCGFSSSSYFRKVLFSVMGKTPTQIRKESKQI